MTIETAVLGKIQTRRREEVERAVRVVLGAVFLLVSIGLVMISSASALQTGSLAGAGSPLVRQLVWCLLAAFALVVAADVDHQLLRRLAWPLLALTVALLALVLVPGIGHTANGARRWIRLGPLGIQPSELAKLTLVIFLAAYVTRRPGVLKDFLAGPVPALAVVGLVSGLVVVEPDFGTALFLAGVAVLLLLAAGMRLAHLAPLLLVALPVVAHLSLTRYAHVQRRIAVFLDPASDPRGKGHQILQSMVALGSGGLTGRGLGLGRQKLYYLPESSTDFVFSSLGEELGFAGTALVIGLFGCLVWFGTKIALAAPTDFGCYLGLGIVLVIGAQAAVNIAVATASVPTKGISLPFVSLGGSSLAVMAAMVGVLVNIGRQSMEPEEELA